MIRARTKLLQIEGLFTHLHLAVLAVGLLTQSVGIEVQLVLKHKILLARGARVDGLFEGLVFFSVTHR